MEELQSCNMVFLRDEQWRFLERVTTIHMRCVLHSCGPQNEAAWECVGLIGAWKAQIEGLSIDQRD